MDQASSRFHLSGAALFEQETRRRDALARRGRCLTGCRELDDQVLLGGFERGCVVGVSTEEEDVGLLIALQTVARLYVTSLGTERASEPRATIITTLSARALLPDLRDTFKAQLAAQGRDRGEGGELLRRFLESISISRIFDVSGLWEALGELDDPASQGYTGQEPPSSQPAAEEEGAASDHVAPADGNSSPLSDAPGSLPDAVEFEEAVPGQPPPGERTEIADSEDEGGSPLSPPGASPELDMAAAPITSEDKPTDEETRANQPRFNEPKMQTGSRHADIILITHMSTLLSSLFRQREKDAAHQLLQLLSSHLRNLSHSPDHGGPLIMVLNSTTNPQETPGTTDAKQSIGQGRPSPPPVPPPEVPSVKGANKPPDPTLRSIFNPPPLPATGLGFSHDTPLSRRNRPSFGLIFTQMLDIHLLCTRVPRTRADAEALFTPPDHGAGARAVASGWVVEVLLDEVGVWEGQGARRPWGTKRASREQRWGAVDVRRDTDGVRVVDASEAAGPKAVPEIVLAAGSVPGGRSHWA